MHNDDPRPSRRALRSGPRGLVGAALAVAALGVAIATATIGACSNGPPPKAVGDGDGGVVGDRDQGCLEDKTCNNAGLLCVGSGAAACRQACEPDAGVDVCGPRSTCLPLDDDSGAACLPANLSGEPCPCDDGFRCVRLPAAEDGGVLVDGEQEPEGAIERICFKECDPFAGDPGCGEGERCRTFKGDPRHGACAAD